MPGMARTLIGAMKSGSRPGAMMRLPSGLADSEASLAMNLLEPTPTEAWRPSVRSVISRRRPSTSAASASGEVSRPPAARSTKASSMLRGSTRGLSSPSRAMTMRLDSR